MTKWCRSFGSKMPPRRLRSISGSDLSLEGTHQFACRPPCLRVPAARQRAASPVRAHGRCTKKIAGLLLGSGPRRNRRRSLARPSSKHHGPANSKSWTPTATGSAAANQTLAPASARPPCVSFRTHSAPKTDAPVTRGQTPRHLGSGSVHGVTAAVRA